MLKSKNRILGYKTAKLLTEKDVVHVAAGSGETGRMTFTTFANGHADTDFVFDDGFPV